MRVAVLGCGSIGARHARNLKTLGVEAIGLHDSDSDKAIALAREVGGTCLVSSVTTWAPDAALICTPAATHAQVARRLLAEGFHGAAFIEKPLALSVEECAIFQEWPSPVTMTGYMLRFHPIALTMKRLLPSPDFGRFYSVYDPSRWPGSNYGPPMLEASHELDLAMWLGMPSAETRPFVSDEDMVAFWSRRGDWQVELNDQSNYSEYFEYSRGWSIGNYSGPLPRDRKTRRGVRAEMKWTFNSPEQLGDQMYVDELAHFLACVEKHEPTITPFAEGIRVVRICEEALKLAQETR